MNICNGRKGVVEYETHLHINVNTTPEKCAGRKKIILANWFLKTICETSLVAPKC